MNENVSDAKIVLIHTLFVPKAGTNGATPFGMAQSVNENVSDTKIVLIHTLFVPRHGIKCEQELNSNYYRKNCQLFCLILKNRKKVVEYVMQMD